MARELIYNISFNKLIWENDRRYKCTDNYTYIVRQGELYRINDDDSIGGDVTNYHTMKDIINLKFLNMEQDIRWSQVPIDTPVYVRYNTKDVKRPRHFAGVYAGKDGILRPMVWRNSATSHTNTINSNQTPRYFKNIELVNEVDKERYAGWKLCQ